MKYDHVFSLLFSVQTDNTGDKVTSEEIWAAILKRLAALKASELEDTSGYKEISEVIGLPESTVELGEDGLPIDREGE